LLWYDGCGGRRCVVGSAAGNQRRDCRKKQTKNKKFIRKITQEIAILLTAGVEPPFSLRNWAASMRSFADPCRSPFESFLNANATEMARLARNCPFMASMALSAASNVSKTTKPKPLDAPLSVSRWILGVLNNK